MALSQQIKFPPMSPDPEEEEMYLLYIKGVEAVQALRKEQPSLPLSQLNELNEQVFESIRIEQEKPKDPQKVELRLKQLEDNFKRDFSILNLFVDTGVPYSEKEKALFDYTTSLASKGEWGRAKKSQVYKYVGGLIKEKLLTRSQLREGEKYLTSGNDFRVFMIVFDHIPDTPGVIRRMMFDPDDPGGEPFGLDRSSDLFHSLREKALSNGSSTPFGDGHEQADFRFEPLLIYWEAVCFFRDMEQSPRNYITKADRDRGNFFYVYEKRIWDCEAHALLSAIIMSPPPSL